jgi:hypothetical protein
MTNGHADTTGLNIMSHLFARLRCASGGRRHDDALTMGASLFTVFLCLFVVLLG